MDGTKEGQDTSGNPQDPSVEPKGTSQAPETFTRESVNTEKEKAVQDALSAAGREAKTITDKSDEAQRILEAAQTTQANTQAERERWQNERDESDREVVHQDPDALKSLNERIRQRNEATKLADRKAELDEKEAKHKERFEKAEKSEVREAALKNAQSVATKHNVDAESLIKFTDGSKEAMEELALNLPKKGETKPPLKTDTGGPTGGVNMPEGSGAKMKAYWETKHPQK